MWYQRDVKDVTLHLYVQPGAKKTEIIGIHEGELKIRLNTPPIEGRANKALLQYIAQLFKVPVRQVILKRGDKSRHKTLLVIDTGVDPDDLF
ncbi:DUF167 domain-containing protein [Fluoribacter dumoffii]|uniref:UPF0235 protein NCTC11370_00779 n=1 Tax=Fluoribacter dumoffii TaxID=463 RepID=A0A377G8C3_9GAMM|nr:DUF167 domain-containing protein [Fluoribacter dumoffii]KTC89609.1 hypothetical protein Ldum_0677 [Fluoribacter dumoffii NY 23]MCW8384802.1 DUF167 domain-containing protein [Fluoribacter dumoffii]MCW8417865.1 DUF167 domain-containing protein [Fluoribacter dumoffii]MCW8454293.1 DUF167 domain-containing protein [Fluoribacter dumoffii]MCW8461633.1 DUF167 domain-containing protein [Fluoribacter dumoffii]